MRRQKITSISATISGYTSIRQNVKGLTIAVRNASTDNDTPSFDMQNPFEKEKVQCILCEQDITPDYKNIRMLSQFQSPYTGRIYGRHITGLCSGKQKAVEKEIMKAQSAGLMPSYHKDQYFLKDPKLFDTDNPIRPHKY